MLSLNNRIAWLFCLLPFIFPLAQTYKIIIHSGQNAHYDKVLTERQGELLLNALNDNERLMSGQLDVRLEDKELLDYVQNINEQNVGKRMAVVTGDDQISGSGIVFDVNGDYTAASSKLLQLQSKAFMAVAALAGNDTTTGNSTYRPPSSRVSGLFDSKDDCYYTTNNCFNRGSCVRFKKPDGKETDYYYCNCAAGFTGRACEFKDNIAPFHIIFWSCLGLFLVLVGSVLVLVQV